MTKSGKRSTTPGFGRTSVQARMLYYYQVLIARIITRHSPTIDTLLHTTKFHIGKFVLHKRCISQIQMPHMSHKTLMAIGLVATEMPEQVHIRRIQSAINNKIRACICVFHHYRLGKPTRSIHTNNRLCLQRKKTECRKGQV